MHILIVDDSQDSNTLMQRVLQTAGYQNTTLVKSAAEAYRTLNLEDPAAATHVPDLILLDIDTPAVDGIQACRRIKQAKHLQDVPVIMVTGLSSMQVLSDAFDAGAMDYIAKPVNRIELLARIRSALTLKQEMDRRKVREQELLDVMRQLQAANARLLALTSVDGLTGVSNRSHFEALLAQEWRRAARVQAPLSLIMLDIDRFKAYNDTFGHLAGDACLRQVAQTLQRYVRRAPDLVARYGGEEFVAILPQTPTEGALQVAESMRANVEALALPHPAAGACPWVTVSVGVATVVPHPGGASAELVGAADRALYQAKAAGRNRVILAEMGQECNGT